MSEKLNRIDAIRELYALGREADQVISALSEAEEKASIYRLKAHYSIAAQWSTQAALLAQQLARIGAQQCSLIDQLAAAGEIIYL